MNHQQVDLQPSLSRPVGPKPRDKDGLHKRRGIWHHRLKIDGRWREFSTRTTNYRAAKKVRQQALQAQQENRLPTDMAQQKLEKVAERWLKDREKLVARRLERPGLRGSSARAGGIPAPSCGSPRAPR